MSRRDRSRRPARGRRPYREPKPKILVVTEGEVTEPEYIEGFKNTFKNLLVELCIKGKLETAPIRLVEAAIKIKKEAEKQAKRKNDSFLKYDQVWCVFDVDENRSIQDARKMARDNDIRLAISNPCFEIWLYLHFAEQPGMQTCQELRRKMKKFIPGYNKHVNFSDYQDGYEIAVTRAKKLAENSQPDKEDEVNPSTSVWKLTEQIRQNA